MVAPRTPGCRCADCGADARFAADTAWEHSRVDLPARFEVAWYVAEHATPILKLRLRLPAGEWISAVSLGGKTFDRFAPDTGTIDLSGLHGRLDLTAAITSG